MPPIIIHVAGTLIIKSLFHFHHVRLAIVVFVGKFAIEWISNQKDRTMSHGVVHWMLIPNALKTKQRRTRSVILFTSGGLHLFLDVEMQLLKRLCPSVGQSENWSVHLSVCLLVRVLVHLSVLNTQKWLKLKKITQNVKSLHHSI